MPAKANKRPKEKTLYPAVERWLRRQYRCFATATNTGLRYSRPDLIGIRDIGGDLSGDYESIAVEVKRGTQPFATASGQALGYRVYANRVYLADFRETPFSPEEVHIASHLGIGLLQLTKTRCREILSSPQYTPIERLHLLLLERLALGRCQLCGSLFKTGTTDNRYANLTRQSLQRANEQEKGYVFWNLEVAERKRRMGIRTSDEGDVSYERRFLCPDCVGNVFAELSFYGE